ncbi:MAG: hypothetical protein K8H84_03400 [Sulfuricella denitrificans]|nr:hypothetical protein [Sulfuricella denitrificans]
MNSHTEYIKDNSAVSLPIERMGQALVLAGGAMMFVYSHSNIDAHNVTAIPIVISSNSHWVKKQQETDIRVREPRLSDHAQVILGENAARRFGVFQQYSSGWGDGHGEQLSASSTAALNYFLNYFDDFPVEPSLFLTTTGNLQLAWEGLDGKAIELDFFEDHIVSYIEYMEEEKRTPLDAKGIRELVDLIKKI